MKTKIYITLLACLGYFVESRANDLQLTIGEALSLAADQKIQSQRVARIYMSLCNNMMEPSFYQERDVAIALFDTQLRKLSLFAPTEEIKFSLERVKKFWIEYKKIAGWSIKKDAGSKLLKLSTGMLQSSNALYNSYVEYQRSQTTTQANSDLVTINEYLKRNVDQQVLVERTMMYYLAEKQGIEAQGTNATFKEAQKIFLRMLNILARAEISSASIRQDIATIRQQWGILEIHFDNINNEQNYMKEMFYSANKIKALLKHISKNYKDLAVKLNLSYSLNEAISQTILVQQISKAYIASHANEALSYEYRKEVMDGVEAFEKRINSMLHTAQTEDITEALNVVQIMWKNYQRLVTDLDNINEMSKIRLMELCYVVMASCDQVTDKVEDYAKSIPAYMELSIKDGVQVGSSEDITYLTRAASNMAGLSERTSLYYMMKVADVDYNLSCKRLSETINEFDKYYQKLSSSDLNSTALKKLLESCKEEWTWMKSACENPKAENITLMLENSNQLRKKMLKTSVLYEHKMNDMFSQDVKEQAPTASAPSSK
ncbi:MAG: hypothetical protein AB8E82_04335 [Aureispira sp.]